MHNIRTERFLGPVFIVGMPRSGTKLLRSLPNEHPGIGITAVETQFLPYWVRMWSDYGDLSDRDKFERFYAQTVKLPYFVYMSKLKGIIGAEEWYSQCREFTPQEIFEVLVRHDVDASYDSGKIWGDKTPSYLIHTPMLCHKAWHKNMIRAAQRWADRICQCRSEASEFASDFMEMRYENLVSNP